MAFPAAFQDIQKRVYLVGLFNDVDSSKRKKFFGLGPFPPGVTLAANGRSNRVSFQDFVNLVKPQVAAVQSGVVDETNWFFRIGDPEARTGDTASLLVGFPGENIFGSVQAELDNLRGLLHRLVNDYFNQFAQSLPNHGGWSNGSWLPEGLLALFIEGIADDWLFSGPRPAAVSERLEGGIDGFQHWSQQFGATVTATELLNYLEAWARDRLATERRLLEQPGQHGQELEDATRFIRDVGAIQKLAQICGSRTLLKLLVFWPYEFILKAARDAWKLVPNRDSKDVLKKYRGRGPYEAWDFLLATGWVNHSSLEEVPGDDFKGKRQELARLIEAAPGMKKPVLAKPQQRDSYGLRRQQVENHVEGWRLAFECEDLGRLDSATTEKIQKLLDCGADKNSWQKVIETARRYQALWGIGGDPEASARARELGKKSASTFARVAVGPAFDALFQTPAFDPSYLPESYGDEFIQLYQDCLLGGDAEDVAAVRKAGDERKVRYQPEEGSAWKAPAEGAKRAGLRFDTSLQGIQTVIDQAEAQKIHIKVALVNPAARYFAYGVNRRIAANPGSSALVYLLRYDPELSGTALATANRLAVFREVMREGIRGDVVAAAQEIIDVYNRTRNADQPPIQAVDVRIVQSESARPAVPGLALPHHLPAADSILAGVDQKAAREFVHAELPKCVQAESTRLGQAKEDLAQAERNYKQAVAGSAAQETAHRDAQAELDRLRQQETATPDDANVKQQREQQEQKSKEAAGKLGESRTELAKANTALVKAKQTAVPVPITFAVDFTIGEAEEIAIADWASGLFQEAWQTILNTVSGQPANEALKQRLRRLLLTEFFLVAQQRLNADRDQWLDLKLLLDLVGSGTIEEFLKKHSLTTYSDRLDDAYGLAGRFNELSRLASSSLDSMRLLVSELHGMKRLLDGCGQDKQIVIFNGTAEEYLNAVQEENLTDSVPTEDGGRTPARFLELSVGAGSPSQSFFAPACVYFTTLAFPSGSRLQKQNLAEWLTGIPLCGHDARSYAMALPPVLTDLGTLSGPTPGEWWKADWQSGQPQNQLATVPIHFVGPSPWLRGPDASAGRAGLNRFTTVLPAGYLFLLRLLKQKISFDKRANSMGPDDSFVFNISLFDQPYRDNLEGAFSINNQKPSFIVTMNLYLALMDALISQWRSAQGAAIAEGLAGRAPPSDGVGRALWYHVAFDNAVQPSVNAKRLRQGESRSFISDADNRWDDLWWNPMIVRDEGTGTAMLAPMALFDMNAGNRRDGITIGPHLTGWLLSILRRY